MIICDSLEIVYIDVPKTASLSLDTFFKSKGGQLHKHSQGLKHGRSIPPRAHSYTKVASVRNPFDRVTSFYYFRKMRNQTSDSFDEFLDFLLKTKDYGPGYNDLNTYIFFPICKYLQPIGYDVILKQESLEKDLKQLLGFQEINLETKNKINRPTWGYMYNKERAEKIIEWAEQDFELFGYETWT